jgi:molybdopterin converting factor small subunit
MLMKIPVKVYGRYKDITGKETIQLNINEGGTLQDIINEFVKQYPSLLPDKSRMMITKNKMFTSLDSTVAYDDEITLAPPVVSGG